MENCRHEQSNKRIKNKMKVILLQVWNPFKNPDIFTGIYKKYKNMFKDLLPLIKDFHEECEGFGQYHDELYHQLITNPSIDNLNKLLDTKNQFGDSWYKITNICILIREMIVH